MLPVVFIVKKSKCFEASVAMGIAMRRVKFGTGYPQSVITLCAVRVDDPACQNRKPLFSIACLYPIEVEPLAACVCA